MEIDVEIKKTYYFKLNEADLNTFKSIIDMAQETANLLPGDGWDYKQKSFVEEIKSL